MVVTQPVTNAALEDIKTPLGRGLAKPVQRGPTVLNVGSSLSPGVKNVLLVHHLKLEPRLAVSVLRGISKTVQVRVVASHAHEGHSVMKLD